MTILFLDDWNRYPEAIVDTKTRNQSYIDMANVYKKMGLKNYYFHLALHDRTLQGVDPFSPDLTMEQMARIAIECKNNFWYFVREIATAPNTSGNNYYLANRGNLSLWWCFLNHIRYFFVMARQLGKSSSIDKISEWCLFFWTDMRIFLLTKDSKLRAENIRRIQNSFRRYPYYLNPLTKLDADNSELITVKKRNCYLNTGIAQAQPESAERVGRGFSSHVLLLDEAAFCLNLSLSFNSASASQNAAIEKAREAGMPYGCVIATTAGSKDTDYGAYAYKLYSEGCPWTEELLDCKDAEELEKRVRAGSNPMSAIAKNGIYAVTGVFSHKQLGKDDAWLSENASRAGVTGANLLKDFLNVWVSEMESSPFNVKQTQMMKVSEMEPQAHDASGYIHVKWYYTAHEIDKIMNEKPVVIGIDSSNMVNNDNSCLVFVDATNLEIIGTASVNRVNLYKFSQWLSDFMIKYRKVMIIPENRSSAQGIIDYLIETLPAHGIDPFRRIFNTIVQEKSSDPRKFQLMDSHPNRMNIANQHRNTFGYTTSGYGKYSRDNLYNETLFRAIDISADKLKDNQLINELLSLVIVNGRIDHPKGGHDDMVIAWLLACWFIFNGRETGYYDINRGRFLSEVAFAGEVLDAKTILKKREQDSLKESITNLYNEMSNTDNYFEFAKLEKEIRYLESKLSIENREQMSISGMIDDLKEGKKLTTLRKQPNMVNDIIEGLADVNTDSLGLNPYNNRDVSRFENLLTGTGNNRGLDLDYWLS